MNRETVFSDIIIIVYYYRINYVPTKIYKQLYYFILIHYYNKIQN